MSRHVVFLIGEDWFFASHFRVRALAARAAGWRVTILTRTGRAADALRAEGFEVIDVDFRRARLNPLAEFRLLRSIAGHYRALAPDLAHHVALKPILLGSLAAALARVPAVINAPVGQGFVFTSATLKARLLRPAVSLGLRLAVGARGALAVFENHDDLTAMTASGAIPSERAYLIRGAGVDLVLYRPHTPPAGKVRIVLGARMLADKGVREFIEAARLLRLRGVVAECLLAGGPDPQNPASLEAAELQRATEATWLGPVTDMASLLASCHIACLPSYREGLPKFLLEAMASGLPCVATDVVGCREAVADSESGVLVPPRDPAALADALERLVADPELRARMGAAGRARAETLFADEVVCAATLAVYERAIRHDV